MPAFNAEIPHGLGLAGAKARLESFLARIEQKYQGQIGDMASAWEGDTLKFSFATFGIKIAGALEVHEDRVCLSGELPFSAMIFKNKIVGSIQEGLERALAE